MKRPVALLGFVTAVSMVELTGCGSRTGALDGFGAPGAGGGTGSYGGGESGSAAGSGTAVSTGTSTSFSGVSAASGGGGPSGSGTAGSGVVAVSGTFVSSGTFAVSGATAPSGTSTGVGASGTAIGGSGGANAGAPDGIPPVVASGCDALCAKEATAMCPNQGSIASCVLGCRALLNNPNCSSQAAALFSCEQTSTVSCDSSGKASLDSCAVQTLGSAACFLQSTDDPTLTAPCSKFCAGTASAKCPNDDPSGCQLGCMVVGNLIPACDAAWKAYVMCADGASFSCGADGKAWAPGCALQALTYLACTARGVTTVNDAGP